MSPNGSFGSVINRWEANKPPMILKWRRRYSFLKIIFIKHAPRMKPCMLHTCACIINQGCCVLAYNKLFNMPVASKTWTVWPIEGNVSSHNNYFRFVPDGCFKHLDCVWLIKGDMLYHQLYGSPELCTVPHDLITKKRVLCPGLWSWTCVIRLTILLCIALTARVSSVSTRVSA